MLLGDVDLDGVSNDTSGALRIWLANASILSIDVIFQIAADA